MKERKKLPPPQPMDLKPVMGLFVVLIPMLLMSAEFAKISIIEINLPENRGSQTKQTVKKRPSDEEELKLLLTAIVTDSVVTIGARGGFMPAIFYTEYHKYVSKEDNSEHLIKVDINDPNKVIKNPNTGTELTIYEREDIFLYARSEDGTTIECLHDQFGRVFVNEAGHAVPKANVGDTLFTVSNPRELVIVTDPSAYVLKPMSAYSMLLDRLMKVKERYPDVPDKDDIIIAAENQVIYDKIIQIMDVAREAGYPNISISKLRA